MNIPEDLKYTTDHEWARVDGETITVGVTYHAQEELTDVVFVELPQVGLEVGQSDTVVVVESVKAASDTFAPVAGEVIEVNEALEDDPALLNTDPYGAGWIYKMKMSDPSQLDGLMSASGYADFIG